MNKYKAHFTSFRDGQYNFIIIKGGRSICIVNGFKGELKHSMFDADVVSPNRQLYSDTDYEQCIKAANKAYSKHVNK